MELKLRAVGIQLKVEFPWTIRFKFDDFILEHFRYSIFQENNYRQSICADIEMKQILISKLTIV